MSKHDEARRAFLKGAAVGAGAIAGTGLVPQAFAKPHEKHKTAAADTAEAPGAHARRRGGAWRLLQRRGCGDRRGLHASG